MFHFLTRTDEHNNLTSETGKSHQDHHEIAMARLANFKRVRAEKHNDRTAELQNAEKIARDFALTTNDVVEVSLMDHPMAQLKTAGNFVQNVATKVFQALSVNTNRP